MRQSNVNGKGAVFQVSDTKWVAKVCLGVDDNGKPIIKQFSGKTEAIAKKKLRDFKKSTDYVEKHIPSTDTVRAYFTAWMKEYQFHKLKPSSYDRLESTVVNHVYPHIGNMKVDKVTRNHIQGLINSLYSEKNLSYSSIKKVYVALNACYKHALIDGTVLRNPCVGISLPSASERTKEVVALSEKEVEQLRTAIMNASTSCTYAHAYLLILNTGMRMGEALSLKWEDVDFSNKTITITKNNILSKKRDENGEHLGGYELRTQDSTKTASGNRTIPLNRSAEAALLELKKGNHTSRVIVNSRQHTVLPSNFERSFQGILKRAEMAPYGIHALRHTFASMLFSKGVDVKIVSKLLGHSSVKITYDTYVHLFEKDLERVTEVLD